MHEKYDVVIIGAGAAGMMSAIECGKRGRKTLLIDHSKKIGEKIRISGFWASGVARSTKNPTLSPSGNATQPVGLCDPIVWVISKVRMNREK